MITMYKLQEYKLIVTIYFPSSVNKDTPLRDDKVYMMCYSNNIKKSFLVTHNINYDNITEGEYYVTLPITDEMIRQIGRGLLRIDIVCEIFDPDFPEGYRTARYTLRTNIMLKDELHNG